MLHTTEQMLGLTFLGNAATAPSMRSSGRGRQVSIGYASEDEMPAYWAVWINTGGWAGHRHFALAPSTGRYGRFGRKVRLSGDLRLGGH